MLSPLNHVISRWLFTVLLTCLMTTSLTACAKEDRVVFHSFNYNMPVDSPDSELLACQYGNTLGTATAQEVARGERQLDKEICSNITGEMLIGEFLNVTWRDKATQQVYEERVDLRTRLPSSVDMRGKEVYFLIDNNQLYVYLIPDWDYDTKRNHLPSGKPPNGPDSYAFLDVKTLYPDNEPPKVRGGRK
jgi:hypothetical protein